MQACPVVGPVPLEAAGVFDNYDGLMMMLDHRNELVTLHNAAIRAFEKIHYRPDQPQRNPRLELVSFFGRRHAEQYYRFDKNFVFSLDPEHVTPHDFFEGQIERAVDQAKLKPELADWPEVKRRDYHRVTSEMHDRLAARQLWEKESGYHPAKAEMDRILAELCALEMRIFVLPVLSFREMQAKLALVDDDRWEIDDERLIAILHSFRDFASSGLLPDRRHDRAEATVHVASPLFDGLAAIAQFQRAIAKSPRRIWRGGGWEAKADREGQFVLLQKELG